MKEATLSFGDPPDDLELTVKKRDAAVVACALALCALVDQGKVTDTGSKMAVQALRLQTHYLGILLAKTPPEEPAQDPPKEAEDPLESKEIGRSPENPTPAASPVEVDPGGPGEE